MSVMHYIGLPFKITGEYPKGKPIKIKSIDRIDNMTIRLNNKYEVGCSPEVLLQDDAFLVDFIKHFETISDATGFAICNLDMYTECVRKHFENSYVYRISAGMVGISSELINNHYSFEKDRIQQEARAHILKTLKGKMKQGEFIEFFSCWIDDEGLQRDKSNDKLLKYVEKGLEKTDFLENNRYFKICY